MLTRAIIGIVFGCTMGIAVACLYSLWGPQSMNHNLAIGVLLILPVWTAALAFMLACDSQRRACAWLVGVNVLCYLFLWLIPAASPGSTP